MYDSSENSLVLAALAFAAGHHHLAVVEMVRCSNVVTLMQPRIRWEDTFLRRMLIFGQSHTPNWDGSLVGRTA
jgi:hypothetical protein